MACLKSVDLLPAWGQVSENHTTGSPPYYHKKRTFFARLILSLSDYGSDGTGGASADLPILLPARLFVGASYQLFSLSLNRCEQSARREARLRFL